MRLAIQFRILDFRFAVCHCRSRRQTRMDPKNFNLLCGRILVRCKVDFSPTREVYLGTNVCRHQARRGATGTRRPDRESLRGQRI